MGGAMTLSGSGFHSTASPMFREISLLVYISELSVPRLTKTQYILQPFPTEDFVLNVTYECKEAFLFTLCFFNCFYVYFSIFVLPVLV
jgi:hypothetical protein